jgi:hypothetical protein
MVKDVNLKTIIKKDGGKSSQKNVVKSCIVHASKIKASLLHNSRPGPVFIVHVNVRPAPLLF